MATIRSCGPSASAIFRFASQPAATSRCAQCMRAQRCPFSSFQPRRSSAKRPLMTESAYRPQTLQPELPPPRNAGTPDTSITSSQPFKSWPMATPWKGSESSTEISLPEGEAQKSKPVAVADKASTLQPTAEASPVKPKKSKLRPRKAPITLTPKAVEQLQALFEQPEGKFIRVGVKNRGCSGLAYHLEYVDKAATFDETVEQDGVKVLIDSKALFSIIGSEMDWLEDKLSARFIFKNPNITEQCGCGESFSIS